MKYVIVQDCPVPARLAPILRKILNESGARLQSCYRGTDAQDLLHAHHKRSQSELYHGWICRLPGYLPANPPGFSTHELRSDGVAYPVKRGSRLKWWQVGIDIDDAHVNAFIKVAKKHGWIAWRPYPTGLEHHHVNLKRMPLLKRIRIKLH